MLFSIKIAGVVAALNAATVLAVPAPAPAAGLKLVMISESINKGGVPSFAPANATTVDKREYVERRWSGAYCDGGATVTPALWKSAIQSWCSQYGSGLENSQGTIVTYKKSVASQFSGLTLANGNPATFGAGYYNSHLKDGWLINENDCNTWMGDIVTHCTSKGASPGGQYGDPSKGSLWITATAN